MGCVISKKRSSVAAGAAASSSSPSLGFVDRSTNVSSRQPSGPLNCDPKCKKDKNDADRNNDDHNKKSEKERNGFDSLDKFRRRSSSRKSASFSFKLGFSHRHNGGAEYIAAGWPSWLSSAAAEAINGWVPLRADSFEKLEKIGQGTYSSVFRAREVETGRMVALKKVRFDNFQPESIRFMAREILILRRLDHPNVIKLEGIITSRLSSSVYLVFEYMEHDLAGLSSSPDVKFSDSQVKCYMKQLLHGIEHCHLRGIIHRDIKVSNIFVNNEGILKIGDFGLANILNPKNKNQLTSRVVTLWYRPPELLMGSTSYGVSVDLWSVGCVFAELLIGKPLLKGRTEVEQLHKIFKLCGSPSEEYWKQCKLPNISIFKSQHVYESSVRERCKDFPTTAVDLIETFLSIEPDKRGTASSALFSPYFNTAPYACDPSSLPKYPPNKEIDAKQRDEVRRKMAGGRKRDAGAHKKSRKFIRVSQEHNILNKYASKQEMKENTQSVSKINDGHVQTKKGREDMNREPSSSFDTVSETSQATKEEFIFTGPAPVVASSGFAWAKRRQEDALSTISCTESLTKSQVSALDSTSFNFANSSYNVTNKPEGGHGSHEVTSNHAMQKRRNRHNSSDSFDGTNAYYFQKANDEYNVDEDKEREKIEFSGPLLTQAYKFDELLQRNESHIRRAARRSRIYKET
ncbi:cyclin-dependent kinase C-2 C isoform X2 [Mercurialis annua]|uniref:cyclin-dependent kinase C-2 C isoform X2 n=1 Tax=Mercurialis annua TaxID=3986 RepID=UPI0024AF6E8F|nr:cyclin-dependent kinase C-2 C isoform X2 [Mercurialis annua]